MEQQMTRGEQNLALLQSLIPSNEKFYVWCYSKEGALLATSCPFRERSILEQSFRLLYGMEKLRQYIQDTANTLPLLIGSPIGLQWALSFEIERNRTLFYVIGPVFSSRPTRQQLRNALSPYLHNHDNALWASEFFHLLPELPVMSYAIFARYVIMVHNTLTGQHLGLDALDANQTHEQPLAPRQEQRDRNAVYLAERAMLQMVRDGDINYQAVFQSSSLLSPGVPIEGQDPLRRSKTSIIVFITLVSRAAIEGGLSPEVAYPLGDSYIQSVEDCRDSGELIALSHAMYHDFIYQVHHLHVNPGYSHAIQKCCDYIALSLDRKIKTADLAALAGYTEYYLTEKFKKETGQSVSSYIRHAKIERAKLLLETTEMSVQEIAESLSFNTTNYFFQNFRETTGMTPRHYREEAKRRQSKDEEKRTKARTFSPREDC